MFDVMYTIESIRTEKKYVVTMSVTKNVYVQLCNNKN